jgi:DNA-directed RNA polymerase subunit F
MKEKRVTVKQAMSVLHDAYDHIEEQACKSLRSEFGFGKKRMQRFMDKFAELSAIECEKARQQMRRLNK